MRKNEKLFITFAIINPRPTGGGGRTIESPLSFFLNLRPGRGGVDATPLRFSCYGRRTMRRIVLKFCIAYRATFAQLLVKSLDWVMSGHGAMTSQVVQGQAIFCEK